VIAFPDWPDAIRARIDAGRAAHDPQANLIAPHLTLVFGVRGITEAALAHPTCTVCTRRCTPGRWPAGTTRPGHSIPTSLWQAAPTRRRFRP
jgi:hypothetical protein